MISATLCLSTLLILVWTHLFADFFLQTDKMAISKSSSNAWLSVHVSAYIIPFLILCGWKFAAVNFVAHWLTDFFSSRATTKLWKLGEAANAAKQPNSYRHWFFTVIGVDQALHMTALILTIPLIGW